MYRFDQQFGSVYYTVRQATVWSATDTAWNKDLGLTEETATPEIKERISFIFLVFCLVFF